ncbi:MAG: hypothetical protein IT160_15110 [Bryobacterales bacterium]|nr:hypothetical protein [Bryobacterales bacterium]
MPGLDADGLGLKNGGGFKIQPDEDGDALGMEIGGGGDFGAFRDGDEALGAGGDSRCS